MIRSVAEPLRIEGGGTRGIAEARAAAVLETGGLSGISLYDPGALTIVAGAGTPLAEVEAALAKDGQRLPFEVPDFRALLGRSGASTLGGVVGTNASGPRRIQAGACRDSLIGVRFVDGAGNIVKNGGRVMKNVTGYDLVKLMAGSHGTLGVLTECAFKVLPAPEAAATVVLSGLDIGAAVKVMASAMGTPFDLTGAAWSPETGVMLRLEGFSASVAYRSAALAKALAGFGAAQIVTGPEVEPLWAGVRDVTSFVGKTGDVWRLSVKPGDAPGLVAKMGGAEVRLDWAGGLIWVLTPEGTDLRARLGAFGGHATLMRASAATLSQHPVFHPEPAPLALIAAGLRAKFDPRAILTPPALLNAGAM